MVENDHIIVKPQKFNIYEIKKINNSHIFTHINFNDLSHIITFINDNYVNKNIYDNYPIYSEKYIKWNLDFPDIHILDKLDKLNNNSINSKIRNIKEEFSYIAKDENMKIIGSIFSKPLMLKINNAFLNGLYVDFLCVDKNIRNNQISCTLINKILEIWKKYNFNINIFKVDSSILNKNIKHISKFSYYYAESTKFDKHFKDRCDENFILVDEKFLSNIDNFNEIYNYFTLNLSKYKFHQIFSEEDFKYYFVHNPLIKTYIHKDNNKIQCFISIFKMKYKINSVNMKISEIIYYFDDRKSQKLSILPIDTKYFIFMDQYMNKKLFDQFKCKWTHDTYYYIYNYACNINKNDICLYFP